MKLIRRDFFRLTVVALGGAALLGRRGRVYALQHLKANNGPVAPRCQFFNPTQTRTLEAVCDQIIPPDDEYPGAKDAGVPYYIDRALTNWAPENRWDYVVGLEGTDESSQLMFRAKFADLKWDEQTRVLEAMEKGDAPGQTWSRLKIGGDRSSGFQSRSEPGGTSSQNFFNLVVTHTMQGYYADPKYGGNKDKRSWKMIGYVGYHH